MFKFTTGLDPDSFCPRRIIECDGKPLKTTWSVTGVHWWGHLIDARNEIYAITKSDLEKELCRKLRRRETQVLKQEILHSTPVYG